MLASASRDLERDVKTRLRDIGEARIELARIDLSHIGSSGSPARRGLLARPLRGFSGPRSGVFGRLAWPVTLVAADPAVTG